MQVFLVTSANCLRKTYAFGHYEKAFLCLGRRQYIRGASVEMQAARHSAHSPVMSGTAVTARHHQRDARILPQFFQHLQQPGRQFHKAAAVALELPQFEVRGNPDVVYHRPFIPVIALSRRAMALVSSSSLRSILIKRKPATAMEKAPSAKFINVSSIFIRLLSWTHLKRRAFTPAAFSVPA
jgi:hypothetical protein